MASTNATNAANSSKEKYQILEQPHSKRSHMKVICVGAGATGLYLAYRMEKRMKDYELMIYEKNDQIGGTWLENNYPGCACDVPAHIYTYSFRPKPDWSNYFAGSAEILEYFKDFEREYDLQRYIQFNSKVTSAVFDENHKTWSVTIETLEGVQKDWCHVLINASGILNKWKWPEIPNRESYQGTLLHSAAWDTSADYKGKNVAVIGTGSSGIQIIPQVQAEAEKLSVFIRSPAWIAPQLGSLANVNNDPLGEGNTVVNQYLVKGGQSGNFTREDIEFLKKNPETLLKLRKKMEMILSSTVDAYRVGTDAHKAFRSIITKHMTDIIGSNEELITRMIPSFPTGCRRLTPGKGFLEALAAPNVTRVYDAIDNFTTSGIQTTDGTTREFDMIICATGFDVAFVPFFELRGRNGLRIADAWKHDLSAYLGIAARGFPNYFVALGPRGPWGNGTILPAAETNADYFITMMQKMQSHDISSIEIKQEAIDDFTEHANAWHKGSVWGANCRNWYQRKDSDDTTPYLWCGMAPTYFKTMCDVRFEDYDYSYRHRNRFAYLGNGKLQAEFYEGEAKLQGMTAYIRNSDTPWTLE